MANMHRNNLIFNCRFSKMGDTLGEIMKQVIFSQFVQFPPLPIVPDLTDPSKYGGNSEPKFDMTNTTNLYITSAKGKNISKNPFYKLNCKGFVETV